MLRKKQLWGLMMVVIVLALLLAACKPSAPTPAAAPRTPPPAAATAAPAAADEWQKVIDAAQKEGKVTLYVSTLNTPMIQNLTSAFKSKYGITTEWVVGQGPINLEKIKNEQAAKAYTADLYEFGASIGLAAKEAKAIVPIPDLPVTREQGVWRTHPFSFDPKDKFFLIDTDEAPPGGEVVFINTKLVPPEKEPKTWQDLLDPQWKGKIYLFDPSVAGAGADTFTFMRRAGILTTEYWEKLAKQNPAFTRDNRSHFDAVSRGEYAIGGPSGFGNLAAPLVAAGAPVKPVWFKEGVVVVYRVFSLVANAPHPNAARLLLNWLMTKEAQTIWSQGQQASSLRTDVPSFAPPFLNIPPDVRRIGLDWDGLIQENQEIKDRVAAKIFGIQ